MKVFSIMEMEVLTGIRMATLRMWEKRYGIIRPDRTSGGTRTYSLTELKKVFAISVLVSDKTRISQLKDFSLPQLALEASKIRQKETILTRTFHHLVIAMYELDFDCFSNVIDTAVQDFDAATVIEKIILPFLDKTGLKWRGKKLTEEHFAVTTIRNKLICCIEAEKKLPNKNKSVLLFLPDTKQLDLLLLITHYQLKRNGISVIYMGYDVTLKNLETIIRLKTPDFLFTYLPSKTSFDLRKLSQLAIDVDPAIKCIVTPNDFSKAPQGLPNLIVTEQESLLAILN